MSEDTIEVKIEQGKLKGRTLKTCNGLPYHSFKGIPYAKPPVDELRFSVPQPPDPWEGVLDATKNCNICAQFDKEQNGIVGDEDCLYLNVYTPKIDKSEPLPVMVFLHGGGFLFGHGTDDSAHGPDYLIEKNVIIVSINYRLGILGFLSLNRKEAPGNMGLRDQVQALKWVQQNIKEFGGNKDNVTIFGVSAGGASVEYLLLSPMAKGLFHRAIAQSGSSLLHWAHNNDVKKLAATIPVLQGKVVSSDDELLKILKSLPTKDLIAASMAVLACDKSRGGIHFGFVPTVEKPGDWEPFLDKQPYQLLAKGDFNRVPYMAGFCSREGLLMVAHGAPKLEKFVKEKVFVDYFPFKLDNVEKTEIEKKLKMIYLEGEQKYKDDNAFAIDYFTDVDFLGGIYVATKLIAKHNAPVYFYEFTYDGSLNYIKKCYHIDRPGACHGDEGGYIIKSNKLTNDLTDADRRVQGAMTTLWTNFAKYGNPTPSSEPLFETKWEPIAETGMARFIIDKSTKMEHEVYPQRMKIYEELFESEFGTKK